MARLSWPGWPVIYWDRYSGTRSWTPDTVTHLSTNWARRRLTSLIETNALTTTPDRQTVCISVSLGQCKEANGWTLITNGHASTYHRSSNTNLFTELSLSTHSFSTCKSVTVCLQLGISATVPTLSAVTLRLITSSKTFHPASYLPPCASDLAFVDIVHTCEFYLLTYLTPSMPTVPNFYCLKTGLKGNFFIWHCNWDYWIRAVL